MSRSWKEVQRIYDAIGNWRAAAKESGLSQRQFLKAVKRGDIKAHGVGDHNRKYDWTEIQKEFDGGLLYKELGERFGVSTNAIQKAIKRKQFIPRSMSAACKIREPKLHRTCSEKTKKKLSKLRIAFLDAHPERSPYLLSHSSRKSYPETIFENALISANIQGWFYNFQCGRFQYDFAFPLEKIDVEIDGGTHRLPNVRKIDKRRDKWSKSQGWVVIRFPAKQVSTNVVSCINKVVAVIQSVRNRRITMNTPLGAGFDKNFVLQMAAAQGMAAAQMLKMKDPDSEGMDDLAGVLFQTGAEVAMRYAAGVDTGSVDANLVAAYEALGSYLRQRGLIS